MSLAITLTLNATSVSIFEEFSDVFNVGIEQLLKRFSCKFELMEINLDTQEILLYSSAFDSTDQKNILCLLKELQQLTLLPYVALINPSTGLILVTPHC
ncbi:MAG: hypothetical protein ACFFC7_32625 [Candidatus Hermodarchaeota archaeon]